MQLNRISKVVATKLLAILCVAALTACSGHTGRMAGEGAARGAAAGAAGGLLSALVFGGDPVEAAARGATWGAGAGAAAGAMSGARADEAEKSQREAELKRLKAEIGEDAYSALEALVDCKHEVALAYARTATKSKNKDHALAGLWVEVLAHGDSREEDKARALFTDLAAKDRKISSEAEAEETMREALQKLMDIRAEYNLPRVCS